jgi:hypothetical protein
MTVAAPQALALRDCLRRGRHRLAHRFFRAGARAVGAAWRLASSADLVLPEIKGKRATGC